MFQRLFVVLFMLGAMVIAPSQQKSISDPAEYNAYMATVNATTPQARIEAKRQAQQRLVQAILPEDRAEPAPEIQGRSDATRT